MIPEESNTADFSPFKNYTVEDRWERHRFLFAPLLNGARGFHVTCCLLRVIRVEIGEGKFSQLLSEVQLSFAKIAYGFTLVSNSILTDFYFLNKMGFLLNASCKL